MLHLYEARDEYVSGLTYFFIIRPHLAQTGFLAKHILAVHL